MLKGQGGGPGYLGMDEFGNMQELGSSLIGVAETIGGHIALAVFGKKSSGQGSCVSTS